MAIPHPKLVQKAVFRLYDSIKLVGSPKDMQDIKLVNEYILGLERIIKGIPED